MRIAVTTIVRGAPLERPAGWLCVVDLARGEQLARCPLPDAVHLALETNPRGGMRGGRGMAVSGDRLAVAVNDRVLVLDPGWQLTRVISHPWMGGLHDLAADEGGIWATCADNDLLMRFDWDGRLTATWHWRADRRLRRALGHGWLPRFERSMDHRDPRSGGPRLDVGHVNAVAADGGSLIVGLGRVRPPAPLLWPTLRERGLRVARRVGLEGLAWRVGGRLGLPARVHADEAVASFAVGQVRSDGTALRPGHSWALVELDGVARRPRLVARHPGSGVPVHNAVPYGGRIAVADSGGRSVLAVDRRTGAIVRRVELGDGPTFPRGLVRLEGERFVVGTQRPAALVVVDLGTGRVEERFVLPDAEDEATYALVPIPDHFDDPVGRLPASRAEWGIAGADASAAAASPRPSAQGASHGRPRWSGPLRAAGQVAGLRRLPPPVRRFYLLAVARALATGHRGALNMSARPRELATLAGLAKGRRTIVDIGTGVGWSAGALALAEPDSTVHSLDPWPRPRRDPYLRLLPSAARRRIVLHEASGSEPPEAIGAADLVFIDGSHRFDPVVADFEAWRGRLAADGVVVFHDFGNPAFPDVARAVEHLGLSGEPAWNMYVWRTG